MVKKLEELYEKESLHKGIFSRGYSKLYGWVDKNLPHNHLSQPKPKVEPNLGQVPSKEENKIDFTKAALGAIAGGIVAGPVGAGIGTAIGIHLGKKKK